MNVLQAAALALLATVPSTAAQVDTPSAATQSTPPPSGPQTRILAAAETGEPVAGEADAACARALLSITARGRALAEQNAASLAAELGGSTGTTLAQYVAGLDWQNGTTLPETRCRHGGASAWVSVVRSATIPLPHATDADRENVSSLYVFGDQVFLAGSVQLPPGAIYATATVPGDDERLAARIAADRAARAAGDLSIAANDVAAVVSFKPTQAGATQYPLPSRFFFPPPSTTIGVALTFPSGATRRRPHADPSAHVAPTLSNTDALPRGVTVSGGLRQITMEASVPADDVVLTVMASEEQRPAVTAALHDAGIASSVSTEFMIRPITTARDVLVERPNQRSVDAMIRRIRTVLADVPGVTTEARPRVRSCAAAEDVLRRSALAELDAQNALDIILGRMTVTDGTCGPLGYFRGPPSSSLTVTAHMTAAVTPSARR